MAVDSTLIKARRFAAGAKGEASATPSVARRTTNIHALTEASGQTHRADTQGRQYS